MAKAPKTAYVCNDCGAEFSRWQGQCSACKAWNTISEVRLISASNSAKNDRFSGYAGETRAKIQTLSEISLQETPRFTSGFKELIKRCFAILFIYSFILLFLLNGAKNAKKRSQ